MGSWFAGKDSKDKASYGSSPLCNVTHMKAWDHTHTDQNSTSDETNGLFVRAVQGNPRRRLRNVHRCIQMAHPPQTHRRQGRFLLQSRKLHVEITTCWIFQFSWPIRTNGWISPANLYEYGVATTWRLLQIICLFCRIIVSFIGLFCKRNYDFKESANHSHPIATRVIHKVTHKWVMSHTNEASHLPPNYCDESILPLTWMKRVLRTFVCALPLWRQQCAVLRWSMCSPQMKTPVSLQKSPTKMLLFFQIVPDILAAAMCSPQMIKSLLQKQMAKKLDLRLMSFNHWRTY